MKLIPYVLGLACLLTSACSTTKRPQSIAQPTHPIEQTYNVKEFGAKGDGVTDDTHAIQSALDYVMGHGGGTLYFPNGRYRLATLQEDCKVKAHLIIKSKTTEGVRDYVMIKLLGANSAVTPCAYASHTAEDKSEVWNNGTILFSDTLGVIQTDPTLPPTSILAAGAGANLYSLNQAVIRLENIAFQAKSEAGKYPYLSGVNMAYAATVYTDNVLIYSSTRNMILTAPSKEGHYSAGFIGPRTWCNPEQELRNIYVKSAFRYGFIFSEHTNGNNLSAWNCEEAFVFSRMDHSAWFGRIHAQNCNKIITSLDVPFADHSLGNSYFEIEQVGIESNNGQKPVDFNYEAFVVDPQNRLYGSFVYHIVKSNVGAENSGYKTIGGANLKAKSLF